MKHVTTLTAVLFTLIVVFSVNAMAVEPGTGTNIDAPSFIDEDGDGVCDTFQAGGRGLGRRGGRGDGQGGENFVDADGDGVCDNQKLGGRGKGLRRGRGLRNGAAFVDADGDGVCDNIGTALSKQRRGRGRNRAQVTQ